MKKLGKPGFVKEFPSIDTLLYILPNIPNKNWRSRPDSVIIDIDCITVPKFRVWNIPKLKVGNITIFNSRQSITNLQFDKTNKQKNSTAY